MTKHAATSNHVDPHFVGLYVRIEQTIHQNRLDERAVGRHHDGGLRTPKPRHLYDPFGAVHPRGSGMTTGRIEMLANLAAIRARQNARASKVLVGRHRDRAEEDSYGTFVGQRELN